MKIENYPFERRNKKICFMFSVRQIFYMRNQYRTKEGTFRVILFGPPLEVFPPADFTKKAAAVSR